MQLSKYNKYNNQPYNIIPLAERAGALRRIVSQSVLSNQRFIPERVSLTRKRGNDQFFLIE